MKPNYYTVIAIGTVLAMGMSGCSVFDKFHKHPIQGSEGNVSADRTEITSDTAEGPVLTPPKQGGAAKSGSQVTTNGKAVKNKKRKGG